MSSLRGIVHGKTIELDDELGLPDGEPVTVIIQRNLPPGEGIRQSAGAWADGGEELDAWLEQTYRSRDEDRWELTP
jgi:hypothetical protein